MVYILDTNIFRKLLDHFPKKGKAFEIIWQNIDLGIDSGKIISVDECYDELIAHFDKENANFKWLKDRKGAFLYPTNEESIIISSLFLNAKMRESIHQKNIIQNRPSADVYLAAKAKTLGAVVVTTEKYKPNSAQLPNICEELEVPTMNYDDFMELLSQKELS